MRRKARCKPGDRLQLYTGQRTKACRKPADAICTGVHLCRVDAGGIVVGGQPEAADVFALADGFGSFAEMLAWFQDRYGAEGFEGFVIRWRP